MLGLRDPYIFPAILTHFTLKKLKPALKINLHSLHCCNQSRFFFNFYKNVEDVGETFQPVCIHVSYLHRNTSGCLELKGDHTVLHC